MADPSEDALTTFRRSYPQPAHQHQQEVSQIGGPGDTFGGMDRVWEKLAEHDRRFDKVEKALDKLSTEVSETKYWYLGTTISIILAGLGLVYAARQDTTATMGAALSAIQTVISAKQESPPPSPPTIIFVPQNMSPASPATPSPKQ